MHLNLTKMSSVRILTNTNFSSSFFFSLFLFPSSLSSPAGVPRRPPTPRRGKSGQVRPLGRHQHHPVGEPQCRRPSPSPERYEFRWATLAIRASFPTSFRRRATSDRRGWGLVRLLAVSGREPDRCCAAKPSGSRRRPHKPRRRRPVDLPSPPRVRTHLHHHPPLLEPTSLVDRWFNPIHAVSANVHIRHNFRRNSDH